jgi:hypothetical protein
MKNNKVLTKIVKNSVLTFKIASVDIDMGSDSFAI